MLARKLFSNRRVLWILSLVALLLSLTGASPALAATCDRMSTICEFDTEAIVPVTNLNVVCTPPSPITQGIQISGDFVIRAHIVLLHSPTTPPSPIIPAGTTVNLHIDATHISGVGLPNGTLYQGSQGTSLGFGSVSNTMAFTAAFNLIPVQNSELPPSPVCPTQSTFQVQLYATELGIPAISASLNTP
jgi:hypothetical protein